MAAHRPFARQGRFTQIDNLIFDHVMPSLKANDWKVLSYIIRHTRGEFTDIAALSYDAILAGTGIASRTTLSSALKRLTKGKNPLVVSDREDAFSAAEYALNPEYEVAEDVVQKMDQAQSKNCTTPSTENGPGTYIRDSLDKSSKSQVRGRADEEGSEAVPESEDPKAKFADYDRARRRAERWFECADERGLLTQPQRDQREETIERWADDIDLLVRARSNSWNTVDAVLAFILKHDIEHKGEGADFYWFDDAVRSPSKLIRRSSKKHDRQYWFDVILLEARRAARQAEGAERAKQQALPTDGDTFDDFEKTKLVQRHATLKDSDFITTGFDARNRPVWRYRPNGVPTNGQAHATAG